MSGLRILLVEDSAVTADMLRDTFTTAGHQVEWSACGVDALVKLPVVRPDVVVLDWLLPDMDGDTFLARFRDLTNTAGYPTPLIVAVSALPDGHDAAWVVKAKEANVVAVLEKPFTAGDLERVLEDVVTPLVLSKTRGNTDG